MRDDVRSLVQQVEQAEVPELWPDITSRPPSPMPPEPGRGHRVIAVVLASLIAATSFGYAYETLRERGGPQPADTSTPSAEPSPLPLLTGDPRVAVQIPLPADEFSGGVSVGPDAAWVGVFHDKGSGSGSVLRIDLTTNQIVADVPVQQAPSRKQIVATSDAVWVASSDRLERIDPATNSVVASVEFPNQFISAIAADGTAVWVVAIHNGSGSLLRVDPATNSIIAEIPLGSQITGYEDEVQIGAGSVWVLGVRWLQKENAEYGSDLIRIDPTTNEIAARIPIGGFDMVMSTDEIWVRFPEDGVFDDRYAGERGERWVWTRVDTHTNVPSEPFRMDVGLPFVTPGGLWSLEEGIDGPIRVDRLDPTTFEVLARSEPIGTSFHDATLDPASGSIWVSAFHSIVRVDIT
jgi:DNA-binding beta-propeller fold protein YncE